MIHTELRMQKVYKLENRSLRRKHLISVIQALLSSSQNPETKFFVVRFQNCSIDSLLQIGQINRTLCIHFEESADNSK